MCSILPGAAEVIKRRSLLLTVCSRLRSSHLRPVAAPWRSQRACSVLDGMSRRWSDTSDIAVSVLLISGLGVRFPRGAPTALVRTTTANRPGPSYRPRRYQAVTIRSDPHSVSPPAPRPPHRRRPPRRPRRRDRLDTDEPGDLGHRRQHRGQVPACPRPQLGL